MNSFLSTTDRQSINSWIVKIDQRKIVDRDIKQKTKIKAINTLQLPYKMIGYGNNRVVYDLNNGFVLKIAISEDGLKSNKTEYQIYADCPDDLRTHLCPVIEYDHGWIIMQKMDVKVPDNKIYTKKVALLEKKFLKSGIKPNDIKMRNLALSMEGEITVVDYGAFKKMRR